MREDPGVSVADRLEIQLQLQDQPRGDGDGEQQEHEQEASAARARRTRARGQRQQQRVAQGEDARAKVHEQKNSGLNRRAAWLGGCAGALVLWALLASAAAA